jgi:hypothetical protein
MNAARFLHILRLVAARLSSETQYLPIKLRAWWMNARVPQGYYERVSEAGLRDRCRGDTLFVLGSGASLAALPDSVLAAMRRNTTMSLNYTILQSFIPADFHLVRELGVANDIKISLPVDDLRRFGGLVAANRCYQDSVFLVQGGYAAWAANSLIGLRCLPRGTRLFRYRNCLRPNRPTLGARLDDISHGASSITDCINIGFLLGFEKIVLCGVDLYDRRYLWQVPSTQFIPLPGVTDAAIGEYGGRGEMTARHRAAEGLIRRMAEWRDALAAAGCSLSVQNPKSLLAEVLPVYHDQTE